MTFDLKQAAEKLGVTPRTVATWIALKELRAFNAARVRGERPRWRVTSEALDEFIASRSSAPAPTIKSRRKKSAPDVIEFYPTSK